MITAGERECSNSSVNSPNHYANRSVETIESIKHILERNCDPFEAYCIGNVVKYISRYQFKNGVEDLRKAIRYIEFAIEHIENK